MIELYQWPPTRSQRARWVLEELGLHFTSRKVKLHEGEQNSQAYRAIHPLGVVPALKAESYTMFESVAIVLQLIDEHPDQELAPGLGSPERAMYYQWSVFACAELDPAIMMFFDNTMRPGATYDQKLATRGREVFAARAEILCTVLREQEFLLGATFCGADIVVGHACFMARFTQLLGDYPVLEAYYRRLEARPAHRRAYATASEH